MFHIDGNVHAINQLNAYRSNGFAGIDFQTAEPENELTALGDCEQPMFARGESRTGAYEMALVFIVRHLDEMDVKGFCQIMFCF